MRKFSDLWGTIGLHFHRLKQAVLCIGLLFQSGDFDGWVSSILLFSEGGLLGLRPISVLLLFFCYPIKSGVQKVLGCNVITFSAVVEDSHKNFSAIISLCFILKGFICDKTFSSSVTFTIGFISEVLAYICDNFFFFKLAYITSYQCPKEGEVREGVGNDRR